MQDSSTRSQLNAAFTFTAPLPSTAASTAPLVRSASLTRARDEWAPMTSTAAASTSVSQSPVHHTAAAVFDVPSAYLHASSGAGRHDGPPAENVTTSDDRGGKRRRLLVGGADAGKAVVGKVLSTALDAAIFTTAVGFAAYQLWRGAGSPQQGAKAPEMVASSSTPSGAPSLTHSDAPPPYEIVPPSKPPTAPITPSKLPRKARHIHVARPRPRAIPVAASGAPRTPRMHVGSTAAPTFDMDDDGDAEMAFFNARLQALIVSGQDALSAPPPTLPPLPPSPDHDRTAPAHGFSPMARSPAAIGGILRPHSSALWTSSQAASSNYASPKRAWRD